MRVTDMNNWNRIVCRIKEIDRFDSIIDGNTFEENEKCVERDRTYDLRDGSEAVSIPRGSITLATATNYYEKPSSKGILQNEIDVRT